MPHPLDIFTTICPRCDLPVRPYELEDYAEHVGYPAVHGCYDHCGFIWTHLHEGN